MNFDTPQTFQVFHYIGEFAPFSERAFRSWLIGQRYVKVADVQAVSLGEVFELTNSIYRPWNENPQVTMAPAYQGGARSTSVGDIIALPGGELRGVASVGFAPLPWTVAEHGEL